MTHLRLRFAAVALLLNTACASTQPDLHDNLVVPGKRIGVVELGMPLSLLLAAQGQPLRTASIPNTTATTYTFANGLTVGAEESVYWIITEDEQFRTANGVGPGVEQIVARSALGKPRCVESRPDVTVYDYGDVYFETGNADGRVKRVGVIAHQRPCAQQG
jgi:hypothetical protein